MTFKPIDKKGKKAYYYIGKCLALKAFASAFYENNTYVTFEQKYNISTKWINEFRKGYWKICPEKDNFQMRKIINFFNLFFFFLLKEYFLNDYKSMFRVLSCLITSIYTYIIMWFYQQRVYTFTERKNRRIIDI